MRCSKCGKEISEQAKFCKYCGTPVQPEKQVSSADTSLGVSKKNSKKWLIIASIVIGILVLTGVIAFTIKMVGEKDKTAQKVEKPKQEDTVKPEEPAEEIKAETPEQAFKNYLVFLVDAVNSGDYTGAEKVMIKDSPLYQEQKKLVEKLFSEGTKEKLTKHGIKSQEDIDDTHVRLVAAEEYEITYSDGTVKTVSQSFAYVCELTEQGWLLTTLEAENSGGTSSSNEDFTISAEVEACLNSFCEVLAWVDFFGETGITEASDANFSRDFAAFAFYTDNLRETGKFLLNKYGYTLDSSDGLQKIKAAKSVVERFLYDSVGKADMTKMQYSPEGDVIVTSGSAISAGVDSVTINSIAPISDTDIQIQGTANYVARGASVGTATYTITMTEKAESIYGGYMLKSIDSWAR